MKKMKKLTATIVVFIMTLAMALPAMAETVLEGSTSYYEEENYCEEISAIGLEGVCYDEDFAASGLEGIYYDEDSSDLCEVYIGNPDVIIIANEFGAAGACYTSGAYTDSGEPDDFVAEDEYNELCESMDVYPEVDGTIRCQPYDIQIEESEGQPYDPTLLREVPNYNIWLQEQQQQNTQDDRTDDL